MNKQIEITHVPSEWNYLEIVQFLAQLKQDRWRQESWRERSLLWTAGSISIRQTRVVLRCTTATGALSTRHHYCCWVTLYLFKEKKNKKVHSWIWTKALNNLIQKLLTQEKKKLHWWKRRSNFNSKSWDYVIYYFLWKCKLSLNNLSLSGQNLFSSGSSSGAKIDLPSTQGPHRVVAEK